MFSGRDRSNRGREGGIVQIEGGREGSFKSGCVMIEVVADLDLLGDPAAAATGCVTRKNGVFKESSSSISFFTFFCKSEVAGRLADEAPPPWRREIEGDRG